MPWWRHTEDVLKMSWGRLECNFYLSSKTSWRRLQDIIVRPLTNTSWRLFRRYLEDVLKTSWRHLAKTSWRPLRDVLKTFWENVWQTRLENFLEGKKLLPWRRLQEILKKSWKRRNVCWEATTAGTLIIAEILSFIHPILSL